MVNNVYDCGKRIEHLLMETLHNPIDIEIDLEHSHKKRKNSLETRNVLLIFLRELEISTKAVQGIHQNGETDCLQ